VDLTLVERARQGDADSFQQLVIPRLDRAYRVALGLTGSEADAHDATQEAFVSAWRKLPQLKDAGRFDAWLVQIVINASRMQIRRRRVREITIDEVHDRLPGVRDQGIDRAMLLDAIGRLPFEQRVVVALHYLDDRPVERVAGELGIPVGTVKSRLFAARRALRVALGSPTP